MTTRDGFEREVGPGGLEARGYTTELRTDNDTDDNGDEGPSIAGLGSPYGVVERIAGWFEEWDEVVADGAWRRTITRDGADIVSSFNHDLNWLLARTTSGTLTLAEEAGDGLRYSAGVNPDDRQAMDVHAKVARGDVTGSSVWFRIVKDQWEEPTEDNELEVAKRTILDAELFEVGPVVFPAFPTTTAEAATAVGMRGLGIDRAGMAALGMSLRTAGITSAPRLADYAHRFLADPDHVEDEIRALFARVPDLRDRVCDTGRAATTPAPEKGGPSLPHATSKDPDGVKTRLSAIEH